MRRNGKGTAGRIRVAVITGASAGVGRATARYFGKRGVAVTLVARGKKALDAARNEIEEAGGRAIIVQGDIADPAVLEEAAERTESELGPIDVWINNAMTSVFAPVAEIEPEEFKRVTEVTYLGAVYGTKAALKRMMPRNRGVIVQVGSALAHRAIPLQSAYCAAKHAMRGFTDSLRAELIHDGSDIKLTMVQLPALNTPQFSWVRSRLPKKAQPVPPIFQPEIAAEAIYWAAHHPRREMMVGFSTMKAIFGQKLIPGLLDHYLAKNAYEGQQTDQPRRHRRDNLDAPIREDRGAHGTFDGDATDSSAALWISKKRNLLALGSAGVAAGAALAVGLTRKR